MSLKRKDEEEEEEEDEATLVVERLNDDDDNCNCFDEDCWTLLEVLDEKVHECNRFENALMVKFV